MPMLPFGELAPDRADLEPGQTDVRNVLPGPSGYLPFHELVVATDDVDTRPRGAIQAIDQNSDVFQYAGDTAKLYQNIDGVWTNRSVAGGYATADEERWEFVAWKNKILAVNYNNNPQQITMGGGGFTNLTTDLRARHIAVVRDFVVMANTFDATDNDVPSRVRWSAFNNETSWTVSPSTLADYQDLKVSKIERVFGGEYGVILQPDRVWRMTFTGAPTVFQFDEVLPGVGVISPGAAAQDGEVVYFLSSKGFFALDRGTQAVPIGAGRVDEFIRQDLDFAYAFRMSTVADPNSKRVFWAYPGTGHEAGRPNRIIVYDRAQDRWSIIDQEVELLWNAGGTGVSLDSAGTATDPDDLDDMPTDVSFDDPRWVGGAPFIAAFNAAYQSGSFSGAHRNAVISTKEYMLTPEARTQLNGFRAMVQGGTVQARVGTRNSQQEDVSYGPLQTARAEGRFTTRRNARYHRFDILISGEWQHATGIEIGRFDMRSGGLRG